ncbi:MAG: dockerin type I domain-containing protein [Candidatus Acetothermia bacterium]
MKLPDFRRLLLLLLLLTLTLPGFQSRAIKISNIEFDLEHQGGSTATETFFVINDESEPVDITVSVGDWYRNREGSNQFLEENAARWQAPNYRMNENEKLKITYRARVPEDYEGDFSLDGTLSFSRPDTEVPVGGDFAYDIETGRVDSRSADDDGPATVTRSIDPVREGDDLYLEITVRIESNQLLRGLSLSESFPVNTELENLDSSDIPMEYVNRSAADWIEVQPQEFTLEPNEEQEVQFTVSVPQRVEGTHWATIYVSSEPRPMDREGTTIMAIKRFAVKVYETIPGTASREAYVTDFSVVTTAIPQFNLHLSNQGNVKIEVAGELRLRDEQGEVVDTIEIDSFPVLPGYERELTLQGEEVTKLSPGDYNAVAILDYGGENQIGSSVSFTVEPLDLQPIGSTPYSPKDLDDDGLYEDIDGNGKLEMIDAEIFSFNYDSPAVQENARAFDFNLDGQVDMEDARKLMRMVRERD